MNDVVIGALIVVTASGTGTWFCHSASSQGLWKPPISEPLWFGWLRKPLRTKRIRSMVKTAR